MRIQPVLAWSSLSAALLFVVASLPLTAAEPAPVAVVEAEAWGVKEGGLYRDPRASGEQCAVAVLEKSSDVMHGKVTLPAGDYKAVFWIEPAPVQLIHSLRLTLKAGNATRNFSTIQFDPAPGYQPLAVKFFHPGGPVALHVTASGQTGFDTMKLDAAVDEKSQIKASATANSKVNIDGPGGGKKKKDKDVLGDLDLAENPPLSKLTIQDLRVACDKIEFFALRNPEAAVTNVEVDKVHYLPGETVKATAKLRGLATAGSYQFVAELITEADTTRKVFSRDVTLAPDKAEEVTFDFKLDPKYEFGHELRCSLQKGGKVVHDDSEYFGVSTTVHRVGITGDAGPQNKRLMTPEGAAEVMERNKKNYANYFECFAWAPSEFCDYTPDEELFWAGQSNFPGSISGFKNLLDEAHKRGIKGTSYSSVGAGGIGAYKVFRRFPHNFVTSDAIGMLSTFFLERAWYKEYNFSDKYEQISWICWNDLWASSGPAVDAMLRDELANSSLQLGWDGYRWDFWPYGQVREFKKAVAAKRPGLIWGYNSVVGRIQESTSVFVPGDAATTKDFLEMCEDRGMMMDESIRYFGAGPVRTLYELCSNEANYVKRAGGLPLIITYGGSRMDGALDVLCALAAGERYTYNTSPGDFPFGPMPQFLTRFSAFVWDDTALIADAGKAVTVAVGKGPKDVAPWHDRTTWLRKMPDGKQQLLINLLNPPGYTNMLSRTQPPPSTLRDLAIQVALPAGVKAVRAFHVSPDLVEGILPLAIKSDAGGVGTTLPELRTWSIVAIDLESAQGELAWPALKLTTPIEDGDAAMKTRSEKKIQEDAEKALAEKLGQGEPAKPEAPKKRAKGETPYYYQFDKTFNADAEAAAKIIQRPDMNILRDGVLDVVHAKGVLSWLNPVELAVGLTGGGIYSCAYTYRQGGNGANGFMQDFPDNYPAMQKTDVFVLDNVHAMDLGPARRARLVEYVRNGGSILYFSGYHTLSCGHDHNTALAEVLPVIETGRENMAEDNKGMALKVEKPGFFGDGIDWAANPVAASMDISKIKPGVEVLVSAGGHPAIVSSTFGKGRVITFLINQHGDYASGTVPYWQWKSYPKLIAACIKYLGEDASKTYIPKREPTVLNPKEVNPANLVIDAPLLDGPTFTKRLASAQKNMVDVETAKTVLEVTLQNIDRVDDLALLPAIAESAQTYVDASFAPLARKLVASQHTVFRRVGLQILGLTGEKELRGAAESALNESDVETVRVALVAIGRFNDPGSIAAVRNYMQRGSEKVLAAGVLRRLGDQNVLKRALPLYAESRFQEVASKTRRIAGEFSLWGGLGSRISPAAYKEMYLKYRHECVVETMLTFDNRYFRDSMKTFTEADIPVLAEFFNKSDTYRVSSLAYLVLGRLSPALATQFRASMAAAVNPDLKSLSEQ